MAFRNGRILAMAPAGPEPEVVVVEGDRIVAAGPGDVLRRFPRADVHDLAGRTLCPGFIDAHHHLSVFALQPRWADVSHATTAQEVADALRAHAAREPGSPWIRAAGWTDLGSGFVPHRRDLDALGLDRPVLVAHYSLHQAVADSRALDALGISSSAPDPDGGTFGRDPDGSLNGLLVERAWSEAHRISMAPYDDPDRWAEHIEAAATQLLADGITAVHDTACAPEAETAYSQLARRGRLPISVLACPHPGALLGPLDDGRLAGPMTGEGSEEFRVGPMKLFADGGVAPAIDVRMGGQRMSFGITFAGLAEQVEHVVARGFRVAVHAIGNAGLEYALDAFTEVAGRHPDADHRFRIEHACLASRPQLERLAALGGIAVVQPAFLHHLGGQVEGVRFEDAEWLAFASIKEAGVPLAASSDCPCTFHEPLRGAHHGVSRRTSAGGVLDPQQSLPFEEWLRAYTAGAAYAGGQESERGSLVPGTRADLVVLDGEMGTDAVPSVAETWVGGRRVFSATP